MFQNYFRDKKNREKDMSDKLICSNHSKCNFYGNRSASISDLKSKEWKSAYSELESFSNRYVNFIIKHKLVPRDYIWPIDPVHNLTRIWEYPYVYHQLLKYISLDTAVNASKIFDIGSALTFLPSFLASLGYQVKASDNDPTMKGNFESIRSYPGVPFGVKDVSYVTCDCKNITTESDSYYDALVCISVLEHIKEREQAIKEFYRILKPEGVLILTVDIKLHSSSPALSPEEIFSLKEELRKYFDFPEPDRQIQPFDILKESNHPKRLTGRTRYIKQPGFNPLRKIKKIIKRKKEPLDTLTAYGMTLARKVRS